MQMLGKDLIEEIGKNLATLKKQKGKKFTYSYAIKLLVNSFAICLAFNAYRYTKRS